MLAKCYTEDSFILIIQIQMGEVQVSARVNPELKKRFEQKAKRYGVSMNGLFVMFMEMIINDKIKPQLMYDNNDDIRTPELEQDYQQAMAEYHRGEAIDLDSVMKER